MRKRKPYRYYVETWDTDKQDFTPQRGVRCGPYSLFGMRKALRKLREMGYSARKGDWAVRVYSPEAFAAEIRNVKRALAKM